MTGHASHHSSASKAHSLIPGRSKEKGSSSASSRFSDTSSSSFRVKSNRKMKFIIAMGIALPILAAIIGVAAWAVSAEAVLPGPNSQRLHSAQNSFHPYNHDLMPMIESRSDLEFGQDSVLQAEGSHPRPSRIDVDLLPEVASPGEHFATTEKDPLYIVHFVPTHKPKAEAAPIPSNSEASENILNKILSVSKGAKPGTPQFVVFAPVPGEDGTKLNEVGKESQANHDRRGVNFDYKPREDIQENYGDDYDEVMVGDRGVKSNRPKTVSRAGDALRLSATSNQEKQKQLATKFHSTFQNSTSGIAYSKHQHSEVPATNYNQEKPRQQYVPNGIPAQPQPRYPTAQQQSYPPTQQKPFPSPNYSYDAPPPGQHPQADYAGAPERSGYVDPNPSPIGIKLNFGSGGGGLRGLLGGGYSPLGLIGNLLGPLLPRPSVNLNGKMMFGVMLENGLKFGGKSRPQIQYG